MFDQLESYLIYSLHCFEFFIGETIACIKKETATNFLTSKSIETIQK